LRRNAIRAVAVSEEGSVIGVPRAHGSWLGPFDKTAAN
jgi:hypothetical protein